MNDVISIKRKLLDRMAGLDYTNMNLADLFACINMLRGLADIPEKSYVDSLMDVVGRMGCTKPVQTEGLGLGDAISVGGE